MSHPRLLPEWAPCRAVLLAWPYPGSDWDANLAAVTETYWQLLDALTGDAGDPVQAWVLLHPSMEVIAWREECRRRGVGSDSVVAIDNVDYDDTWVRDYGPLSRGSDYLDCAFNGWGGKYPANADDQVSRQLDHCLGQYMVRQEWVLEGGAIEVNGAGVLLANKDCVVDRRRNCALNEEQIVCLLRDHLGVERVEWLEGICLTGDDTDGHIDTIARFADESSVVYAGRNAEHPDSDILRRLHQQVRAIAERNQWRCLELPSPVVNSVVDGRALPATYTNFLIVNQRVFVPVYGVPEDSVALAVLRRAFPMRRLVSVNCAALVEQHGSLHCATMQIAHHGPVN